MRQNCKFCKGKDIVEPVAGLGVDVVSAIESGIIKDTSATTFHNMMKDTSEIGIFARDAFDIIDYEHAYTKFRKHVNDKEKDKSNSQTL